MDGPWQLFDPYSRRARFFPALLALLPLAGLLILFPGNPFENISRTAWIAFVAAALAYLTASFARNCGKKYEASFLKRTGGWQTTVLLRHRDETIDRLTKSRYHHALHGLSGVPLPTSQAELQAPDEADQAYRSATKVLIERRRGKEFRTLHSENAAYGFWRNLAALRPITVCLSFLMIAIALVMFLEHDKNIASLSAVVASLFAYPQGVQTIAYEILCILVSMFVVNDHVVLTSARTYAEALFKTLDAEPVASHR